MADTLGPGSGGAAVAVAGYPSPHSVSSLSPNSLQSRTHHTRKPSISTSSSLSFERAAMASSLSLNQHTQSSSAFGVGGGIGGGGGGSSSVSAAGGPSPGAASGSREDKSALSTLNLGFLKTLTEKRGNRADGQPPKRRGPKPDSKPALTRRQELNRQAQRTHRERKELYIKALEDEVLRLKEIYSTLAQDKEKLAEENRQLRSLLTQNGMIPGGLGPGGGGGAGGGGGLGPPGGGASGTGSSGFTSGGPLLGGSVLSGGSALGGTSSSGGVLSSGGMLDDSISNPASVGGYTSSGSVAGSYAAPPSSHTSAFTPPPLPGGHGHHHHPGPHHHQHAGQGQTSAPAVGGGAGAGAGAGAGGGPNHMANPKLDYDQAGIDFVLTLEKPCMDHMPWLLERSTSVGGNEPCGHALMASCPPEPFPDLTPDIPFGYTNIVTTTTSAAAGGSNGGGGGGGDAMQVDMTTSGQRTWELSKADLATLLDLSRRLNLDGEITPVMAWGMVLAHPRMAELGRGDFQRLTEELIGKVRCYGFGAVMEEFEVRDALENVLSTKPDPQVAMVF